MQGAIEEPKSFEECQKEFLQFNCKQPGQNRDMVLTKMEGVKACRTVILCQLSLIMSTDAVTYFETVQELIKEIAELNSYLDQYAFYLAYGYYGFE
ncbi:hypothetical protein LX87_04120 [Larkinella arboricola]|uniref:Uncharacterized protein n=2 Tax=Larkinella arboricola TaxID=643671 RepID=A0A327WXI5_LARAB|nr:hypothetical protein LX87_04120 [Larkinella arboricola]